MKRQKKSSPKKIIASIGIVCSALLFIFLFGIFLFAKSYQKAASSIKPLIKLTPTPTLIPTPTIDMNLSNSFKTYTSPLYGFSVMYPALGEDNNGNIITCGDNIEELTTHMQDPDHIQTSLPIIHLDSFFQITLHPWGSQLADYIGQDQTLLNSGAVQWTRIPNIDEAVIIRNTQNPLHGSLKNVFALYKKGNLIYQMEKTDGYAAGCQMLFDPKSYNQLQLAKNQSSLFQTLLFPQYKNWDEAASIQFSK